jgi:hypothetical protein
MDNVFFDKILRNLRFFKDGAFFDLSLKRDKFEFIHNDLHAVGTYEAQAFDDMVFGIEFTSECGSLLNKKLIIMFNKNLALSNISGFEGKLKFIYV